MAESIVNISQMTDALRNTGYKNLESAVAEIVDNSIEANASEIFIILTESSNMGPKKGIKDIAVLDNGDGMNSDTLNKSLGLGSTTRAARKSMGRFGVGLPQASLYATSHVEVYSWQHGLDSSEMVYLDVEEIKLGEQTEIADPLAAKIPDFYKMLATCVIEDKKFDFTQSGTLVVWKNCDRLNPKTRSGIIPRFEKEIGKKFRHYIHKKKCEIWVITIAEETGHIEGQLRIKPNDPLLLMEDNWILGDKENLGQIAKDTSPGEPIFKPYPVKMKDGKENPEGKIIKEIKYRDLNGEIKTGKVTIQFSIVKDKFYDKNFINGNPGSTEIGKAIKHNVGISVVRHDREIDFGKFDYFKTTNSPTHRWWGCEISFEPALDEVFGVSNNKQQIELRKPLKEEYEEELDPDVKPLWEQLEIIERTIKEMVRENQKKRADTRSQGSSDSINLIPTQTQAIFNAIEDPIIRTDEEVRTLLQEMGYKNEITQELIEFWRSQQVRFIYDNLGETDPPFSFDQKQDLAIVKVNIDNSFYTRLVEPLENLEESTKTMFELLLGSYSKALLELYSYSYKENVKLTKKWRTILEECIDEIEL